MKKIFCFILTLVLLFNNIYCIYASDISTQALIGVDTDKLKNLSAEDLEPASLKFLELIGVGMNPAGAVLGKELNDAILEILGKDGAMKKDDDGNIYVMQNTVNEINTKVQDSVHALDGYYLCEPTYPKSFSTFQSVLKEKYETGYKQLSDYSLADYNSISNAFSSSVPFVYLDGRYFYYFLSNTDLFLYINNSSNVVCYYNNGVFYGEFKPNCYDLMYSSLHSTSGTTFYSSFFTNGGFTSKPQRAVFGAPFKLFYSRRDLENYLNNGKQRTYAPKLPNVTIKIPVKYINNSVSLPDITYNITTENKTEVEIQNQYDTTINNYLNSLDDFSDGSTTTPTPTPSGGFTDGTTPTPTPAIGDGGDDSGNGKVDLSEITDLLKKILDKLTSFADSHSKFEKTITDYIEANGGKLDQIIDAIDKLSQGKEDGEDYKCKYDYTELSDYLKKLWNDSDKKFDTMIDLLEENNEYQQKLVDTLDSIKSILIKESIMDSFKDRSKETANKAKEKFPTSVPWDIAIVINAMSATPEEPKFNLPIKIASLNIDENIEVDLSSGEWEKLAKTCRYMLSLLFVLFMVQLSRRLFFNKGDDD